VRSTVFVGGARAPLSFGHRAHAMKRLLAFYLGLCLLQSALFAVGVVQFTIAFPGAPPPPTVGVPSGGAELSGSLFTAWAFLGTSRADYGRTYEMAANTSLTPLCDFGSVIVDPHPPTPGIPGNGGMFYSYFDTWTVTQTQASSLLEGRCYMEVGYGAETHLGQIAPVPEPTSALLLTSGIALWVACRHRRSQRPRCDGRTLQRNVENVEA